MSIPKPIAGPMAAADRRATLGVAAARTFAALCALALLTDRVYVTIDIDVLDPAFAPGTGTPEAGGLSTRDLLELLRIVFRELPVRALDLVEVSPPLDPSDITSFAAAKVIYEVFGWVRDGRVAETLETDAKRSN